MISSLSNSEDQIITKNLSFIYESVYKTNRDEINIILKKNADMSGKDDTRLDAFKALNSVNLTISKGNFIAIVGDTGSGKSSLVRTFNGLIPSFYRGIFFGYVGILGKDSIKEKISSLSQHVGLVFQNPENQLVAMTVEREIAFGLENLGIQRDIILEKIAQIMEYLEISHLRLRHPYELSGGEQQRVAIASILTLEPDIIILDEPTASLDPKAAESVLEMLKKLNRDKNITVIIIEHRLEVIFPYCNEIIVVQNGRVLKYGSTVDVMNSELIYTTGVRIPEYIQLFRDLQKAGKYIGPIPTTIEKAVELLRDQLS